MLDIKFIKDNAELIKANNESRGVVVDVNRLITLYNKKRKLQKELESWRAEKNKHSKAKPTQAVIDKLKKLGDAMSKHEAKVRLIDEELRSLIYQIPNLNMPDVPIGKDASDNKVLRSWGEKPKFDFKPLDHVDLGKNLDIIDTETSALVSGTRFNYLKNEAVWLQFALVQLTLEILTNKDNLNKIASDFNMSVDTRPFIPVIPPDMIKPEVYTKMARLNEGDEDKYYLQKDDVYLIGSAEHTMGPMHMDKIFSEESLPLRYIGYSTSFRREAGAYGKDTRGILRVHQFDKLEIESFTTPEDAIKEQDFIVAIQEYLVRSLNLPYQVILLCSGDMGLPDARQIDIETWMPGQDSYRETHTSDMMTDYQSRRLNTKVKRQAGELNYVYMNDATAFAIGRMLIAILENNQQSDGSVIIPKVLHKYLPFKEIKSH